jgi:hypothetical protein
MRSVHYRTAFVPAVESIGLPRQEERPPRIASEMHGVTFGSAPDIEAAGS